MNINRPKENMGMYFHQLSKDISMGGQVNIPKNNLLYPQSWQNVEYKEYLGAEIVQLCSRSECFLSMGLSESIHNRRSNKNFKERQYLLTKLDLSKIIYNSVAVKEDGSDFRVHPSGGGMYPLEYYFYIKDCREIKNGLYHFNLKKNALELISQVTFDCFEKKISYDWALHGSVYMFISSVFNRSMKKYGERGYRNILIEVGHVGQNVYLTATAIGLSICALTGVDDVSIEEIIGIDGEQESLVYSFVIG